MWGIDAFILVFLVIEVIVLMIHPMNCFMLFIGIYGLIDVLSATLRDVILSPSIHQDANGRYIKIRDSRRWILLTILNIFQVIICFSIIYLCFGSKENFSKEIIDPLRDCLKFI